MQALGGKVSILKSLFDQNRFGALRYLAAAPTPRAPGQPSDVPSSSSATTTPSAPAPAESPYGGGQPRGARGKGEVQVHLSKNTFRGSGGMQGPGGVVGALGAAAGITVLARHNVYVDDGGFRSSD